MLCNKLDEMVTKLIETNLQLLSLRRDYNLSKYNFPHAITYESNPAHLFLTTHPESHQPFIFAPIEPSNDPFNRCFMFHKPDSTKVASLYISATKTVVL